MGATRRPARTPTFPSPAGSSWACAAQLTAAQPYPRRRWRPAASSSAAVPSAKTTAAASPTSPATTTLTPAHRHRHSFARSLLGEHNSPEAILGGDYLLEHPVTDPNNGFYFYGVYYISQAYNQLGGKYWETGYPKLRDALLAAQNDQGVWPNGSGQEQEAGDALPHQHGLLLALCVPYPVFAAVSEVAVGKKLGAGETPNVPEAAKTNETKDQDEDPHPDLSSLFGPADL